MHRVTILTWHGSWHFARVDVLRGVLEVIMKNTLPLENEAIKEGCKQQREEWVWLHSWGNPPTSLTPERSAESAGSDEDSRWQLATGGCNTVSEWSGRTARRLRCTEQHLTRAPPACSGITVSSHVTLQKPVDSDRRHCLAAHSGQVVLHLTNKIILHG